MGLGLDEKIGRGYRITGRLLIDHATLVCTLWYGGRAVSNLPACETTDYDDAKKVFDNYVTWGKRLMVLFADLEMAEYNMRCYEGKSEYTDEYEECKSKVQLFKDWIYEMVSDKPAILHEFCRWYTELEG